jgi:hypothetical protein
MRLVMQTRQWIQLMLIKLLLLQQPLFQWLQDLPSQTICLCLMAKYGVTTEKYKYLGIRAHIVIERKGLRLEEYWETVDDEGENEWRTASKPECFGERFFISYSRFKLISMSFRMSRFDEAVVAPDRDPWLPIRPLVDAFNKRRQEVVVPGEYITVDE